MGHHIAQVQNSPADTHRSRIVESSGAWGSVSIDEALPQLFGGYCRRESPSWKRRNDSNPSGSDGSH